MGVGARAGRTAQLCFSICSAVQREIIQGEAAGVTGKKGNPSANMLSRAGRGILQLREAKGTVGLE